MDRRFRIQAGAVYEGWSKMSKDERICGTCAYVRVHDWEFPHNVVSWNFSNTDKENPKVYSGTNYYCKRYPVEVRMNGAEDWCGEWKKGEINDQ